MSDFDLLSITFTGPQNSENLFNSIKNECPAYVGYSAETKAHKMYVKPFMYSDILVTKDVPKVLMLNYMLCSQ